MSEDVIPNPCGDPIRRDDQRFMRIALDACRQGVEAGQSPFGACIVDPSGQVLAASHNHVWADTDITAHGEIVTIRQACQHQASIDLAGCTIYSTTEPCPMCFSAIHWARIDRIVFGARVEDAARFGFNELPLTNATIKQITGSAIELTGDVMRDQAIELFELFVNQGGKRY